MHLFRHKFENWHFRTVLNTFIPYVVGKVENGYLGNFPYLVIFLCLGIFMYLILKGMMYSNLSISLPCADSTNIWWSSCWGFFTKGASFSFWTDCFQTFKMFCFLPFFLLLKVAACGLLSGCLGQVLTQIISLSQICHPLALSFPFSRLFQQKNHCRPSVKRKILTGV